MSDAAGASKESWAIGRSKKWKVIKKMVWDLKMVFVRNIGRSSGKQCRALWNGDE